MPLNPQNVLRDEPPAESMPVSLTEPKLARFEDLIVGVRVRYGSDTMLVTSKDDLRVNLENQADPRRTLSLYGGEVEGRQFEIIPAPVKATR
jgi:hypothetical protein